MTDRYKVYTKVLKTLKQMVKLHHSGRVVTLAMMIAGIVMSKKAQLFGGLLLGYLYGAVALLV